jgi:hypothetical protein
VEYLNSFKEKTVIDTRTQKSKESCLSFTLLGKNNDKFTPNLGPVIDVRLGGLNKCNFQFETWFGSTLKSIK